MLKSRARLEIGCLRGMGRERAVFSEVYLTKEYIGKCWDLADEVRRGWRKRDKGNNSMKGYSVIMDGVDLDAAFSRQLGCR